MYFLKYKIVIMFMYNDVHILVHLLLMFEFHIWDIVES